MSETTPIFDEVAWHMQNFKKAVDEQAPKINKALKEFGEAAQVWQHQIEQWGRQFGKNQRIIGTETPSHVQAQVWAERRRRQIRREIEQRNCLHGRTTFEIRWGVVLKCPNCYSNQVYVGSERLFCLMCGWKQWRIGKRRVRFTNG